MFGVNVFLAPFSIIDHRAPLRITAIPVIHSLICYRGHTFRPSMVPSLTCYLFSTQPPVNSHRLPCKQLLTVFMNPFFSILEKGTTHRRFVYSLSFSIIDLANTFLQKDVFLAKAEKKAYNFLFMDQYLSTANTALLSARIILVLYTNDVRNEVMNK